MRQHFTEVDESELGKPHLRRNNPVLQANMPAAPGSATGAPLLTLDIIRQNLYTFFQVATATKLTPQTLFTTGQGGWYTPIGGAAFQLTELHTNLLVGSNGGLANPQRYMLRGLCRYVREDVAPVDLINWNFSTYVELDIGDTKKPYFQGQLCQIPQPNAVQVQNIIGAAAPTTPANGSPVSTTGWPVADNYYALLADGLIDPVTNQFIQDAGITIDQGQYFALVLDPTQVGGAFPVYTTVAGIGIIAYFHFIGVLGRSAQ
jgi:hypothetical protein